MTPAKSQMTDLGNAASLPPARRNAMARASEKIIDSASRLAAENANVVSELLRGAEGFFEWQHYPKGDVYDSETHAQFYYHSHDGTAQEHGHFHTFLRAKGMPPDVTPVTHQGSDAQDWPAGPDGDDALTHFVGIRMDHYGVPTHLFTTNRWVTGETFYAAPDVIRMLDRFTVGQGGPSPATNRWISAMLVLFRPQIETLLIRRDAVIDAHRATHEASGTDIFEDRDLNIASICEISIIDQIEWLGLLD